MSLDVMSLIITIGTTHQAYNLLAILIGLTKLLLSWCTKSLLLTAFLAALKMISETYESIPIIEAILLGPCLSMDSIVKSECTSASLRPSAISSV